MTPLIGLTAYREQARWGVWDTRADLLPEVYARAVEAVGGVPVLLPPTTHPSVEEAARLVVSRLDGLVISGGADVSPHQYAAEPHPRTRGWRDDRDTWEIALLDAAEERVLPVLGVCRGMQVMAVRAGGTLEQHLPDEVGHEQHGPSPGEFGEVGVRLASGTRLASLVGDRSVEGLGVRCHHHQAVREHPGFAPVAWAEDGTLEAMEAPGARFCVAVQWHPEMLADVGLFAGLVEAARR
ncbi:gamma-glutamyl-gamma-aminobutyrate hydrolase family protein [Nocardioides marmoribigeumensis]|uniref:Glutamine amidotransferase n=1 Tax=Nocardioides marmoribigeumensis TaxID=433649 RepID=A0ABU2BYN2_9ACTN|nr:gamma-glutamyl-gamma-aminobutyrate hydrolase family protein [Nocardioides marmoribigeumensis]MDR7363518.1 putative glutamine amidotransferase [Nocardioides marmoribigeumensis]